MLVSMLEKHEGRQARAAAELGITRQALWAKLRRLGVWPSEPV
jgi:transcriptional regulator of acetoin/glycerol metabolism